MNQNLTAPSDGNLSITAKIPRPQSISSNILFTGNIYFGRYINDWSLASPLKYQYPFSRLNEFNRDQYNAWIAGLECPSVGGVNMTSAEEDSILQFNCSPDYLPEVAKWFTVLTLANNHTDNQGVDGFNETKQHLEENGIQYFGHYDPYEINDNCEVVGMPVIIKNDDDSTLKGELPVAMCGFHGVFKIPPEEALAEMQKYSLYMPVIAMPHMGAEYQPAPDELKTATYRSMIDNGADMVIGDHPHWIQTTESYNGHLILYSMGNFIFDQQFNSEVTRSAALNVSMNDIVDSAEDLEAWLAFGKTCIAFKDDCLDVAKAQNLKKLNISYKFGIVGSNNADKINKPATPDQQASILLRLNWQSTLNGLQAPYSGL
jgi:poly-gamma-glutamate synthesis protein (capsule biosynthesis protein)